MGGAEEFWQETDCGNFQQLKIDFSSPQVSLIQLNLLLFKAQIKEHYYADFLVHLSAQSSIKDKIFIKLEITSEPNYFNLIDK